MVDASSLSKSTCLLHHHLIAAEGYRAKVQDVSLTFGIAFHKFAELRETLSCEDALLEAVKWFAQQEYNTPINKKHLNRATLMAVCEEWDRQVFTRELFKTLRRANGKPLVELKFSIPYFQDNEVEVVLSGTMDRLGRYGDNGAFVIKDYKTTSTYKIEDYFNSYRLSGQLSVYQYAVRWYADKFPKSIFAEICKTNSVGCQIDGIFLNADINKVQFRSSEVFYYTEEMVRKFDEFVLRPQIMRIVEFSKLDNQLDRREGILNSACETQKFGKCEFFGVCCMPDKLSREMALTNSFTQKQYNPLKFHD